MEAIRSDKKQLFDVIGLLLSPFTFFHLGATFKPGASYDYSLVTILSYEMSNKLSSLHA
jgi:hypothetical protein